MDPVSPVAQLAVAAISGAAFLISMVVIPFPESKADSSAAMSAPSEPASSLQSLQPSVSAFLK